MFVPVTHVKPGGARNRFYWRVSLGERGPQGTLIQGRRRFFMFKNNWKIISLIVIALEASTAALVEYRRINILKDRLGGVTTWIVQPRTRLQDMHRARALSGSMATCHHTSKTKKVRIEHETSISHGKKTTAVFNWVLHTGLHYHHDGSELLRQPAHANHHLQPIQRFGPKRPSRKSVDRREDHSREYQRRGRQGRVSTGETQRRPIGGKGRKEASSL